VINPFAGLLRCGRCDGTAVVVNESTNWKRGQRTPSRSVVCERAKIGAGCTYKRVTLDKLVGAFRPDAWRLAEEVPARGEGLLP
jgi:hypothetical protein